MLAENSSVAQTERVLETAQLPRIFQQYQLTIAILLAVAACILVKLFMDRTALGYEIRAVGLNPDAAETAGISKAKVTIVPCASAAASRAWPAPAMCWAWTAA